MTWGKRDTDPEAERPGQGRRWRGGEALIGASLFAAVSLLALLVRLWFGGALDLRDLPGPASGHILTLLATGDSATLRGRGVDGHLGLAVAALGGDTVEATRTVMLGCGLAGVLGAILAGWALAGRWGGVAAGLMASTWSLSILASLLISYDTVALGASWLGLGLALAGAAVGWWGVPGVAAGCLLVVYGLGAKEVAHPILPLLGVVPFLAGRDWRRFLVLSVVVGVLGVWGVSWELGWGLIDPHSPRQIKAMPEISVAAFERGLRLYFDLLWVGPWPRMNVLLPLWALAVLGALLPGPRWGARVMMLVAMVPATAFAGVAIGTWLRLRYLTVFSLPVLLLAACAVAILADLLARIRLPRVVLPALVSAGLLVDALDYAHAWTLPRQELLGVAPAALPRPRRSPWLQNGQDVGTNFGDFSLTGGIDALAAVAQSPAGAVATVPLRDSRHTVITAGAALHDKTWVVIQPESCCVGGKSSAACAAEVVAALDAAGALLLLPKRFPGDLHQALPHEEAWRTRILEAAQARQTLGGDSRFWWTFQGAGEGGELPCEPLTPARSSAPRRR